MLVVAVEQDLIFVRFVKVTIKSLVLVRTHSYTGVFLVMKTFKIS